MKFILFRHGQTDSNIHNIIQGAGLNTPLNVTGIAHAANQLHCANYPHFLGTNLQLSRLQLKSKGFFSNQSFLDLCDIYLNHISPIVTIIAVLTLFVKKNLRFKRKKLIQTLTQTKEKVPDTRRADKLRPMWSQA